MNLIEWHEAERKKQLDEATQIKVLKEIARLRASYPAELARNLYLDIDKVNMIIDYLLSEGAILKLSLDPDKIDDRIRYRISYFWKKGIIGYFMFNRMNWLVQNPKPYWGGKK